MISNNFSNSENNMVNALHQKILNYQTNEQNNILEALRLEMKQEVKKHTDEIKQDLERHYIKKKCAETDLCVPNYTAILSNVRLVILTTNMTWLFLTGTGKRT